MSGLAAAARLALAIAAAASSGGCVGGATDRAPDTVRAAPVTRVPSAAAPPVSRHAEPGHARLGRPAPRGPVAASESTPGSLARGESRLFPRALDPIPPLYVPPPRDPPLQPVLDRSLPDSVARPARRTSVPAPPDGVDPLRRIDPLTGRDPLGRVDPSGGVDLGHTRRP